MSNEIECSTLDLRYESYRIRNTLSENKLLGSIIKIGIENPLRGIDAPGGPILLDGFKRYRCARKLKRGMVPYVSLSADKIEGIAILMRGAKDKPLTILEQARFVTELHETHKLNQREIADELSHSVSWVNMRLGLFTEMPATVREEIFRGAFPLYSYMYTVRSFMRMKPENASTKNDDAETFVRAMSKRKLSIREIDNLAHVFFKGSKELRNEIAHGHIDLVLRQMRNVKADPEDCNAFETTLLKELEWVQKYMERVMRKVEAPKLKSHSFFAQANLLTAGIISKQTTFFNAIRRLNDRSADAPDNSCITPERI